jgi:hypothetical protein
MKILSIFSKNGTLSNSDIKITQFERMLLGYKCLHNGLKHFLFNGFLVLIPKEKWDFIIFIDPNKFDSVSDLSDKINGDFLKDSMPTIRNYTHISNDVINDTLHLLTK